MQSLKTKFRSIEEDKFEKSALIRLNFMRPHLELTKISKSQKSPCSSTYTFVKARNTKHKKENKIYDFLAQLNVQQIHWDVMMRETELNHH